MPIAAIFGYVNCTYHCTLRSEVRVIGKPLASRLQSAGQRLALVSKSAGQRTKRIFKALLKLTNKMAGSMG